MSDFNLLEIPVWQPFLDDSENSAICAAMKDGYLGMGKTVFEFEEIVANEINCTKEEIVSTHTGQSALHTILESLKLSGYDLKYIITPSMNNVADFQAIIGSDCDPIYCDCNPNTGLIDLETISKAALLKAKALIALDYGSNLLDLKKVSDFCKDNNLLLIYDAAHSFGSVTHDRLALADATMFSFDPIKTFTAIDAGIIHSKHKELVSHAKTVRHMGMKQDLNKLKQNGRSFDYDVPNIGYRYHLSNIHAVVGIEQIKKKEKIAEKRHGSLQKLRKQLNESKLIISWVPYQQAMIPFMNVALIKEEWRDELRNYLIQEGIQTGIHWKPGHLFSTFKGNDWASPNLDNTLKFYASILSLPLFPGITDIQESYIASKILQFEKLKSI